MRQPPTFVIVTALGIALASLVQRLALAPWAAFMLGLAYLMVTSLVINTLASGRRSRADAEISDESRCRSNQGSFDVADDLSQDRGTSSFAEHPQCFETSRQVADDAQPVGATHCVADELARSPTKFEGNSFEDAVFIGLTVERDPLISERASVMVLHEDLALVESAARSLKQREADVTATALDDRA